MADLTIAERGPHAEAEELLPWYATGRLDAAERARVESHLYECEHCRRELAAERRIAAEIRSTSPIVDSGWARLKERIEPSRERNPAPPSLLPDIRALLRRPAFAALAAAQIVFVIMAGALLLSLTRPAYHALGSASAPPSANVIVMFRADAKQAIMRDDLRSAGASIVGGPTATDAFLLHVDPKRREASLKRLRSSKAVALAEPIDGVVP